MQQGPSGMPFGGGMPQRGFADGGGTDYGMLAKRSEMQELGNLLPSAEAGNPLASTVLHDVGGSLPMQGGGDIPSPTFPGSSPPPIGGPTPIPSMQLQPGGGKSGPYGQFMMMQSPSMGSQSQSGGVGQAIGMAEKVLPMLAMMREGGIVNPFAAGEGYADGGSEDTDINAYNDQSQPMWKRVGLQSDPDAMPPEITAGKSQVDPNSPTLVGGPSHVGFADESPTGGFQGRPQPPTPFGGGPRPYAMSPSQAPYPDALQRDWGQNATRSPWMALVKAGAQMMQTRGPIGSVIGAGLGAGAGELESQRKELRSEEDINQKAEHLAQQAQFHLDEYTKIKPGESEHLKIERERLEQENWKPFQDMFGNTRFFNSKTGEIKEAPPHGTAPIAPSSPAVPGVPTSSLSDPKVAMLEEGTPESKAEVARVLRGSSILKTETMSDDIPADVFSNPLAGKQLNEQAISDMAPAQRAIIKMMVQGKMPPVSSFALSKPFWQNMIGRAALYDPDFDLTKWGARNAALKEMTSGATAKNVVRRMNTAANHLDLLDKDQQSLDAFASGSFGPATGVINKGRAKWLEASQDPRIAAVNADANAVSTELETAFKGSNPTLEGIKAWRSNMQPGMARDEMSTVNNRFVNLIKGQLDSVSDMWERAYGVKTDPMMFMSPKARATYERLGSTQQTQPAQQSFTGRTASGPNGQKLRETADGKWIQ
jgi:hypothetical protein